MKYTSRISSALFPALIAFGSASLPGCSEESAHEVDALDGNRELGELALQLQLAPDVSIDSVRYQISGNGFFRAGSVDVSSSPRISLFVGGIPAGTGYTILLEAGGPGQPVTCSGSATFDIVAHQTSTVSVALSCQLGQGTGGVVVDATTNVCPVLDELTAAPTTAIVGATIALSASSRDLDSAPQALTYAWTSTLGSLSGASTPSATLTCTAPGEGSVTLTYSDGACVQTITVPVRCEDVSADAGVDVDGGNPDAGDSGAAQPGLIRITEWMYDGPGGEWVELTNVGGEPVDMTGFSYDDDSAIPGVFDLSGFGVVQPGESVVFTESAVEAFRATWGLCSGVKLLGGYTNNLGRNDQINIFDASGQLYDRLTYGDQNFPGSVRTTGASGWTSAEGLGANNPHAWTLSTMGDSEGSYRSTGNAVGSPGQSTRATVAYDPCGAGETDGGTLDPDAGSEEPDAGGELGFESWPGSAEVNTVDAVETFTGDLSGLTYEPATATTPARLWAVENGSGLLYRLEQQGALWLPSAADDWAHGKSLRYPDGAGRPDSEGVTKAEWSTSAVYVATERNNAANGVSRPSILRFESDAPGSVLTATHEWNLVTDLPAVGANLGLEAITWIPDDFLVAHGFFDESKLVAYDPSVYPGHGTGLFFVGLEGNGLIYAYALDHDAGTFQRVATVESGFPGLMGLEFDREQGLLWAACDNTCENRSGVLQIDTGASSQTSGRFVITARFERPAGMSNLNNEGVAMAPESECIDGEKSFLWTDDSDTAGHSLRQSTVTCAASGAP